MPLAMSQIVAVTNTVDLPTTIAVRNDSMFFTVQVLDDKRADRGAAGATKAAGGGVTGQEETGRGGAAGAAGGGGREGGTPKAIGDAASQRAQGQGVG